LNRKAAVSGMFYSSDPVELRSGIEQLIEESGRVPDASVTGIVSPHAGYVYSGRTAAAAFASSPAAVQTVVVIAPCHRFPVTGASVFAGEGYETPIGVARVNSLIVNSLQRMGFGYEPGAHAWEHAEEVQVPFIQVRWPDARIVPIVQGAVSSSFSTRLASAIAESASLEEGVFVVASSDLSHYHPLETAREMDNRFIEAFLSGRAVEIESLVRRGAAEACGAGPVMTLLDWAAQSGAFEPSLVAYDTSASASGDSSAVVGYMAGVTRSLE